MLHCTFGLHAFSYMTPTTLGTRYIFFRAWHSLHIFRFQYSRACLRLPLCMRLAARTHIARFLSASCLLALATGYTFVHLYLNNFLQFLLVYENYYLCWLVMNVGWNHCILNNFKVPALTTTHGAHIFYIY